MMMYAGRGQWFRGTTLEDACLFQGYGLLMQTPSRTALNPEFAHAADGRVS